ncbi:hypothetical protein QR680_015763 [Steinernema hermaphroditum]|uniref:MADF domain-containing protein n=1 Tax=Steinernema hermaphroditum TaxID=289476 RepID=A0AA39LKS5_9BILA|nr:hypothetical protein QR680_015763 [Steinernema hermaphroditum]
MPTDDLKRNILKSHPELLPFFEKMPLVGFDSHLFLVYCCVGFGLMGAWAAIAAWCYISIVKHLKAHRDIMTDFTYRLHIKLLQALLAQTVVPIVLIVIPLSLVLVSTVLHLDMVNDLTAVGFVIFSAHTSLNSLAMIFFIPAYRKAVVALFRKLLGSTSRTMEARLIELVQENALLYDKTANFYNCDKKREKTWIEIAEKIAQEFPEEEHSVKALKTRWSSLRTVYTKKKRTPPTGSSSQSTKWIFFDSMRFLDSFTDDRKTVTSMNESDRQDVDEGYESSKEITANKEIWIDEEDPPSQSQKKRKREKNSTDSTSEAIIHLVEASNKQLNDLEHRRNYHFGMEKFQMDDEKQALVRRRNAILLWLVWNRRTHHRRWKKIYASRNRLGEYAGLFHELREDQKLFKGYTRMTLATFEKLLRLVTPYLEPKKKEKTGISPEHMLVLTLRYLAIGASFRSLHYSFRMGVSTVAKVVKATCRALYMALKMYVRFPETSAEWNEVSKAFEEEWNFPHVLGAIDGKHIKIVKPPKSGSNFFNYKKFFSTVLLGVCNADYQFIYYDIGNYGHHHDSHVFESSSFGRGLRENRFQFPDASRLEGSQDIIPYFFLGDCGFPLKPRLMKPFPGETTERQSIFNSRLSRARRVIEDAFGILATRWRLLLKDIETSAKLSDSIVRACIHLHNYLSIDEPFRRRRRNHNGHDPEMFIEMRMDSAPVHPIRSQNPSNYAKEVRENLSKYFEGSGSVPWQGTSSQLY